MPHSTLILYNGGSYGTYLEWVLTTLTSTDNIVLPFTDVGNSHLFVGNYLNCPGTTNWQEKIDQSTFFQFARAHPKLYEHSSIRDNLLIALNSFDQIIFCYPDQKTILLTINNVFTKIWDSWIEHRLTDPVFADNLYTNWNVDPATPADCIPIWIVRELLSYNLMPSWKSEVEWFLPDVWNHPRCKFLFVSDLLYNFESVVDEIKNFCRLDFKKEIKDLLPCHAQMLNLQKYLTQDSLCSNIVDATINAQSMCWESLPLASQSWIQWQLRNLGYEIRCNGLDKFPTNSIHLQELIYKA
jgi:hypothetical protein